MGDRVHELVQGVLRLGGDGLGRGLERLPVLLLDLGDVLLDRFHVLFDPLHLARSVVRPNRTCCGRCRIKVLLYASLKKAAARMPRCVEDAISRSPFGKNLS